MTLPTPSSMPSFRLYKKEKLCSTVAIEQLFGHGGFHSARPESALAFPIRAIWRNNPRRRSDSTVQFLISVPKKRLRHAVDRVTMRRRIREAYRLQRHLYPLPPGSRIDVVFLYVAGELTPYARIESSMRRLLGNISASAPKLIAPQESISEPDESCE